MRYYIIILLLFLLCVPAASQSKYEVRAAWITTAYGLDWPRTRATSPESIRKQQVELIDMLDKLYEANFNTVLFQARARGDVFYNSAIEPYSSLLTGQVGRSPGYDPLAFVIEECHKRGMECHAWIVGIPLGSHKHAASLGKQSVTKKRPAICASYKNGWYLNPAHPGTKEYLMELTKEMITNYDIDGVHFDYLRYPEHAPKFPDQKEYNKLGKRKPSVQQWRRDNLTEILRYIYKGVKAIKPWVKVSTSPVGKYGDTARYPSGGWNANNIVFQDVKAWLNEGIQDQIYPMMYFRDNHYFPFALDWHENNNGRHIISGLGIYFLDPKEGNWSLDDVERQINFTRYIKLEGQAFYRMQFLMENTRGIYDELYGHYYTTPALQPPMPWLDNVPPTAPSNFEAQRDGGYISLKWNASKDNDTRNAPYYVLYGSDTFPVDTSDPANIIDTHIRKTNFTYAPVYPWERYEYYAVTAVDRYGNESGPAQTKAK